MKRLSFSKGKDSEEDREREKTNSKKREKIKSEPFTLHASKAPKRIKNNWAQGILSSFAIRLS